MIILRVVVLFMVCLSGTVLANPEDNLPVELTILSYHEIADKSETLDPTYCVSPTNFVRQMDWLKKNGYHFISMNDLLEHRAGKKSLLPKSVLLPSRK